MKIPEVAIEATIEPSDCEEIIDFCDKDFVSFFSFRIHQKILLRYIYTYGIFEIIGFLTVHYFSDTTSSSSLIPHTILESEEVTFEYLHQPSTASRLLPSIITCKNQP